MPRDQHLCRRNTQLVCNRLHLRNIERLFDLSGTSKRRVGLKHQIVLLSPLEELRLRVEVVEFDLVDGGFVFEGIAGEVLDSVDVEAVVEDFFVRKLANGRRELGTYLLIPMLRILPLSTSSSSFCQVGYGLAVNSLSKTLFEPFLKAIGLSSDKYVN